MAMPTRWSRSAGNDRRRSVMAPARQAATRTAATKIGRFLQIKKCRRSANVRRETAGDHRRGVRGSRPDTAARKHDAATHIDRVKGVVSAIIVPRPLLFIMAPRPSPRISGAVATHATENSASAPRAGIILLLLFDIVGEGTGERPDGGGMITRKTMVS